MTKESLLDIRTPFDIRSKRKKHTITVIGFSQNDPLGVGGGIFPDMSTAYFQNGGWVLVKDLITYYDLVEVKP